MQRPASKLMQPLLQECVERCPQTLVPRSCCALVSRPCLAHLQIELTSESDLFFHYTHTIGPAEFQQVMQEAQKLMVDFNSYPAVFLRMVNSCIQAPQTHIAVLLMEPSGAARLDFIQVIKLVLCCVVLCFSCSIQHAC